MHEQHLIGFANKYQSYLHREQELTQLINDCIKIEEKSIGYCLFFSYKKYFLVIDDEKKASYRNKYIKNVPQNDRTEDHKMTRFNKR